MKGLDRRRFVIGTAALAATVAAKGGVGLAAGRALVPRTVFFGDPDVAWARMSPDGRLVAYIAPVDGVRNVWVAPLDDLAAARPVTRVTSRPLAWMYRWAYTSRHIVFFEDRDGDENWRASSVDVHSGAVVPLTPPRGVRAHVQEASPRFPREMLLGHNERDRQRPDIYRIDLVTGRSELVYRNERFAWVFTDKDFQVRFGCRYLPDGRVEWLERRGDDAWVLFFTVPLGDVDGTRPVDVSHDGRTLYLLDSRGRDTSALVAMDLPTRRTRVVAADPSADLRDVFFDEATGHVLAAGGMLGRQRWHAVDPRFARDLATIRAAARGGDVYLNNVSRDGRRVLVFVDRDDRSPEYALYDRATRRFRPLVPVYRRLAGVPLRPLEPVTFPARDGLTIHGYLTLPEPGARDVPMILDVHGGPYWRDRWGFESTHQWLANRGYAVLSVNFRGSTGFGKSFVTAADGEWGGKMHDDLIDGVRWAIGRRIADPARVGIYGGSYGGYAALVGATRTPETFACVVDVFGIANLLTFMAAIPPYWRPWFSVWKKRVGDPDTEAGRAFLRERSPLTHIARAARPILVAQGLEDVRVTRAESEQIVAALRERGVPVTYITFRDEGHGFARPENHLAFRAVTEAFLARHLGGAAEPIDRARDFAGSTLVVETGADLVPGLAG
jgi:dipeptidyl aminopeptidase/acylaminoacyl peptidase